MYFVEEAAAVNRDIRNFVLTVDSARLKLVPASKPQVSIDFAGIPIGHATHAQHPPAAPFSCVPRARLAA